MDQRLGLAIEAHDECTQDLLEWALGHREALAHFRLVATGTTGRLLREALDLPVEQLRAEPIRGIGVLGAGIHDGRIDMLIFFWNPLSDRQHETDAKALLRAAVLSDIPTACTPATADHLLSSHHLLFATAPGAAV